MRSARVILANWKNTPFTLCTAHSIAPQMEKGDHLATVDNGFDDGSLIVLREGFGELRNVIGPARISLVNVRTSDGFGTGVIAGVVGPGEDAVALLSNDATMCNESLDVLPTPLGGAVGATVAFILLTGAWRLSTLSDMEFLVARGGGRWTYVVDGDSSRQVLINSTGDEVGHASNDYDRSRLGPANSPLPAPEVFSLCGGACVIDADAWRAVGGVHTDLFMYYKDTDLSYKLREAGYEVYSVTGTVVDHEHTASPGMSLPMFLWVNVRNRIIVAAQYAPWGVVARIIARLITRVVRSDRRGPVTRGALQRLLVPSRVLRHRTAPRPRRQGSRSRRRGRGRWARHSTQRGAKLHNAYALIDWLT